jgi:hypothetical protein
MTTAPTPPAAPARRAGGARLALFAGVAAAVAALGFGVAAAQTGTDNGSTTSTTVGPNNSQTPDAGPFDGGRHRGGHGPGGKGFGGPGIHGEFTVPDGNGGYRTLASQVGTVTSVSPTAIEVKSEDGFTKKYVVSEDTMVNAGRDGIADVKSGDKVAVQAVVANGTANAVDIRDVTKADALRQKWAPTRPSS